MRPYVYALVDPRDGQVFYIGKGTGRRMYQHALSAKRGRGINAAKTRRITEIHGAGLEVDYKVLGEFQTHHEAYQAERAFIKAHKQRSALTNANAGGTGGPVGSLGSSGRGPSLELTLRRTEDLIARLVPYTDWINERRRSNLESDCYQYVSGRLHALRVQCLQAINPRPA
jgi:hypothetical protein